MILEICEKICEYFVPRNFFKNCGSSKTYIFGNFSEKNAQFTPVLMEFSI